MNAISLKDKTAKGIFFGGIGSFSQQITGAIFGIIIARILSPHDYGLIAMLAIFTAIASIIMDSGFTNALINKKSIKHEDYNAVFWFSIFSSIFLYIILFFLAPLIAYFYNQPVLVNLSRLMFLTFIFSGLGIAHNAFLLKNIMAKQRGIIDFTAVLCSGIVGLILALKGYIFWGLAIQAITQSFVSTVLRWCFSPWRPSFNINFSPLKEMFGFSSKIFITNIIVQSTSQILSVIFGRCFGKEQTGLYSQGHKWAALGTVTLSGMINGVSQPVLVEAVDDPKRFVNIFRKMVRFGAFVFFPCLLGLAFVGEEFILITIGEKWLDSLFFLQIFCIWGSVSFLWILYTNALLALGKSDIYMWGVLFLSLLQICLVLCLISSGMKVMTSIFILLYFIAFPFFHYHINKLVGLRFWDTIKDIVPYLFVTLISLSVAWAISCFFEHNYYLSFSVKVTITILLYVTILKKCNSIIFNESYRYLKTIFSKKSVNN